jgi:hypothetical protein
MVRSTNAVLFVPRPVIADVQRSGYNESLSYASPKPAQSEPMKSLNLTKKQRTLLDSGAKIQGRARWLSPAAVIPFGRSMHQSRLNSPVSGIDKRGYTTTKPV